MLKYWTEYFTRNGIGLGLFLLAAVLLWMTVMIILPQLYMVDFSFRANVPPPKWHGPEHVYTLEHYKYLIYGSTQSAEQFNSIDLKVFGRTIMAAVFVTLIDLCLCYPVAYYLAHVAKGGWGRLMVMSLIIPFWVNEILRAFAFKLLFGSGGVINNALVGLGILDQPYDFVRENVALYSGLSYAYILFMVFMLTAGALAAPQVLGGPSSLWFTQIIYKAFNNSANWARGSAYALVLLIACIIFVLLMMRIFKVRLGEIAR